MEHRRDARAEGVGAAGHPRQGRLRAVGGPCTVTFVLRGGGVRVATGSVVAAPGGSSGIWRLANAPMALGLTCKGNAGMGEHGNLFSLL